MMDLGVLKESVIKGDVSKVKELVQAALTKGIAIEEILNSALIAAMTDVGKWFERKDFFLPEVLFAARAMRAGMDMLEPHMLSANVEPLGKIILGTVQGDVHDIGKNLVDIMLKGAGFEVIDLGIEVPPQKFIDAAQEGIRLIGMSALTSTTIPFMQTTIEALEAAGLKGKVKTMVGGAIVTQSYADRIGADGYAEDAVSAVKKAKELLKLV
ncbi:MAG: corrinoid protein [Thermodesulfobacteriota bacterium]|nr:corrinoid protein [Thermodesulfobacteriota bacterium]